MLASCMRNIKYPMPEVDNSLSKFKGYDYLLIYKAEQCKIYQNQIELVEQFSKTLDGGSETE